MSAGAYWGRNLASDGARRPELSQPFTGEFWRPARSGDDSRGCEVAPPVGFEPTLPAPEADALSPELWGLRDVGKSTSERALLGHAEVRCSITGQKTLPSRA